MKRGGWERWLEEAKGVPQTVLCGVLGTTRKVVLDWEEAGMPRNGDQSYDLAACVGWVKERYERRAKEAGSNNSPWLERKREAEAKTKELQLARMRGDVVETQRVTEEWSRLMTELKTALLGLPTRLAPRMARKEPKAVAAVLEQGIRDVVERVRDWFVEGAEPVKAEAVEPKAKAKPKARAKR